MNNYIKKTIAMYSAEELKNIRFNIVAFSEDPALLFNEKDNVNTNGEKMSSICYKHAKENAPDLADGYLECPPHLFYTDDIGFAIRRVYGMAMTAEKAIVAQVVTAMTNHNNDVVGGIQLKDLVPIKQWSNEQLNRLKGGLIRNSDAFLRIDGFVDFLS